MYSTVQGDGRGNILLNKLYPDMLQFTSILWPSTYATQVGAEEKRQREKERERIRERREREREKRKGERERREGERKREKKTTKKGKKSKR
ncbi:hypothetical protein FHG87_015380 [Trinorchestia longiramus]|nr:hypothetical protein FHG87_015380 [Trinorchestia longiramus]